MSDHDPRIDRSDPIQAEAEDAYLAACRRERIVRFAEQLEQNTGLSVDGDPLD